MVFKAILMALLVLTVLLALIGILRRFVAKDTRFEAVKNLANNRFEL